ncbi:chemotaxis protein CheW [Carboxylicivirga sp. N1Y90]|uniref:chemotaxis protein CheW n=1 Tax=Carboxylicivirga fragile TaxID=3417571 RepID=UPI003D3542A9|nr:purine-binding chemotaxis protein CheW [Marinilabiliaceae bacterium N1Y90]
MSQQIDAYLTFTIGENTFGIHVEKVLEIKEYLEPKSVPESLPYIKGVIDHRDQIIPVIDAAAKFNMGNISITPQSCIVVMEVNKSENGDPFSIGVLVDAVSDVFESDPEKVRKIENDFKPGYINATYKINENLVMILDTDKVFNEKDIIALDKIMSDFENE